ncbi:UEV domain-containing protein [Mycena rosella]|uniref:UEV domain-containing protein n=1 Tax=Mycena rosella TaxID=1033263 RepID=A0AAD7H283_MYCRO|nr:UEV domain-containing protein [Mycena rosella]
MDQLSLTHKWLRENVASYPAADRVFADIDAVLARFPSLRPKSDVYTYDDGRTQLLLCVHGLLPITFRSAAYNIPIAVWLTRDYPREPPLPYVVPTADMLVKPGPHLDVSGRSTIDHVQQWARKSEGCSLAGLVDAMQAEFSRVPPVYAKPKEQPLQPRPQSQASQSSAQQPPSLPPKPQTPQTPQAQYRTQTPQYSTQTPPAAQYTTQQQHAPTPHAGTPTPLAARPPPPLPPHLRPDLGPPQYRSAPAPTPAPPHYQAPPAPWTPPRDPHWTPTPDPVSPPGHYQYAPQPPAPAPAPAPAPNFLDEDSPDQPVLYAPQAVLAGPAPPRPPNPELLRLHAAVHAKLSSEVASLGQALSLDAERLRAHQADLLAGEPAIRDEMARLEAVRDVCRTAAGRMRGAVEAGERNVADLRAKSTPEVDELVCSTTIVHNQLINLVAEDNAIEDTIYHLSKALNSGRIDLERFLRSCRLLAEEQFMKRALIEKIQMGIPMGQSGY